MPDLMEARHGRRLCSCTRQANVARPATRPRVCTGLRSGTRGRKEDQVGRPAAAHACHDGSRGVVVLLEPLPRRQRLRRQHHLVDGSAAAVARLHGRFAPTDPNHDDTAVPGHLKGSAGDAQRLHSRARPHLLMTDPAPAPRPTVRATTRVMNSSCGAGQQERPAVGLDQPGRFRGVRPLREHRGSVHQKVLVPATATTTQEHPASLPPGEHVRGVPRAARSPASERRHGQTVAVVDVDAHGHESSPSAQAFHPHELKRLDQGNALCQSVVGHRARVEPHSLEPLVVPARQTYARSTPRADHAAGRSVRPSPPSASGTYRWSTKGTYSSGTGWGSRGWSYSPFAYLSRWFRSLTACRT